MAEKRMFSKTIVRSDAFLDMSATAQLLYFHLSMEADDEGFVDNPNMVMRVINSNKNDFDLLVAKKFVITFDDGLIVIKHWFINNYIRADRSKATTYTNQKELLFQKENGAYSLSGRQLVDTWLTNGCIDKSSIDKSSIDKNRTEEIIIDDSPKQKEPKAKTKANRDNFTPFEQAIIDFKQHRKQMKSPMTDKAVKLILNKLDSLADNTQDKITLLDTAIEHGWKTVYAPKDNKGNSINIKKKNMFDE